MQLLLLDEVKIAAIEDDLLYLLLGQQAGEEVARVGLADDVLIGLRAAMAILVAKDLSIGLHLLLKHQKVHHLMEHGRLHLVWSALVGHLGRGLARVDFERLNALAEA